MTTMTGDVDHAALQLALDLTLADDPPDEGRVEQVRWKLENDGWEETARFCAFHQQIARLKLSPCQTPPCYIDHPAEIVARGRSDNFNFDHGAAKLLLQMRCAGMSDWHPNPLAALADARRTKVRKRQRLR